MHIVLYVLDALRADHLGCYGYERETSPHIDASAREGVVFENCFTSATWTRPVAASILTGTYPGVHLTRSRYDTFSTNLTRLPEVLKAGGFKTAAFSTMGNLASEIGFDRGFDRYYDLFRDPAILTRRRKRESVHPELLELLGDEEIALPRAEDVHDYLFPWLEEHQADDTFSFIWSVETHTPYAAPVEFRRFSGSSPLRPDEGGPGDTRSAGATDRGRLINLYDDEILYNDHCIGQIVGHLKRLDIYDKVMLIIVSDHGDAFYEHGIYEHGHIPYEELVHVPLVIKLPHGQYAGRRVVGQAELIDLFPTIASAAGAVPGTAGSSFVQGYDLLPLVDGTCDRLREYTFSDTHSPSTYTRDRYLSVRTSDWKYIRVQRSRRTRRKFVDSVRRFVKGSITLDLGRVRRHIRRNYSSGPDEYLFDVKADPAEQHNLALDRPDLISQFSQLLTSWQQRNDELAQQVGSSSYSYEESETLRRHLEELGYL